MTKSKQLVFFGTEDFSAASLTALINSDFDVVAVVTKPDSPRGRNRVMTPPLVKIIAEEAGIPVLQPQKLDHGAIKELKKFLPAAGVLVSYGKILPQKLLDMFTPGIINVHPSLLPKYRGPSPIEAAIVNGDEVTGVTIMQLIDRMDAGPIYLQHRHHLNGSETKPELYSALAEIGADLLKDNLASIISGDLPPKEQQDEYASYCSLLKKEDGLMDVEHKTAEQLEREVRAYLGFPKSRLNYHGFELIVTETQVAEHPTDDDLVVECAHETYLQIIKLTAPSGKTMSGKEFLRGYAKN